jgi:hypothetical protein
VAEGGEIDELLAGIEEAGIGEVPGVNGAEASAVVAGVAVEIMILGLEIDMAFVVFAEDEHIGFHDGFIVRVIETKGLSVEADESYL